MLYTLRFNVVNIYISQIGDVFSFLKTATPRAFSFVCDFPADIFISIFQDYHP